MRTSLFRQGNKGIMELVRAVLMVACGMFAQQSEAFGEGCACGDGKYRVTINGGGMIVEDTVLTFTVTPEGGDPTTLKSDVGRGGFSVGLATPPNKREFYLDAGATLTIEVSGAGAALAGTAPDYPSEVDGVTGWSFGLSFAICGDASLEYVSVGDDDLDPSVGKYASGISISGDEIYEFKLTPKQGSQDHPGESSHGVGADPVISEISENNVIYESDLQVSMEVSLGNDGNGLPLGELIYRGSLKELTESEPPDPSDIAFVNSGDMTWPISGDGIEVEVSDVKETRGDGENETLVTVGFELEVMDGSTELRTC